MTKKVRKNRKSKLKSYLLYLVAAVLVLGTAFYGSRGKGSDASGNLNVQSIASSDFNVSVDQLSEFYIVASLASAADLASTDVVSTNYVAMSTMSQISQSSLNTNKLEKPTIVDTSHLSRGVITYTVGEEETMSSIAASHSLTTDQIRWSNGLKSTKVTPGQTLYLPSVPGIVYTVKNGDTVKSLAKKYKSSEAEIISANDLEISTKLTVGSRIVLPGGVLPAVERPEYVPSTPASSSQLATSGTSTYNYTFYGSSRVRENMRIICRGYGCASSEGGNPGVAGQCTWYAWWYRYKMGGKWRLPTWSSGIHLGNAYGWYGQLAGAYKTSRIPRAGSIFQTTSGYYGHVGIVTGVNGDGSITVREMNYAGAFVVTESTIPASQVGNYNYIHERK